MRDQQWWASALIEAVRAMLRMAFDAGKSGQVASVEDLKLYQDAEDALQKAYNVAMSAERLELGE